MEKNFGKRPLVKTDSIELQDSDEHKYVYIREYNDTNMGNWKCYN